MTSGAHRLSEQENDDGQEERLGKLSMFQITMIKHAMKCEHTKKSSDQRNTEIFVKSPAP